MFRFFSLLREFFVVAFCETRKENRKIVDSEVEAWKLTAEFIDIWGHHAEFREWKTMVEYFSEKYWK